MCVLKIICARVEKDIILRISSIISMLYLLIFHTFVLKYSTQCIIQRWFNVYRS